MSAQPTPEEALKFMYSAMVLQHIDLAGPWAGWKIRGQYLISPDKDRAPVRELVGLLFHYRSKFGHRKPHAPAGDDSTVVSIAAAAAKRRAAAAGDARGAAPARPVGPSMGHGWPALQSVGDRGCAQGASLRRQLQAVGPAPKPPVGRARVPLPADRLFFVPSGENISSSSPEGGFTDESPSVA